MSKTAFKDSIEVIGIPIHLIFMFFLNVFCLVLLAFMNAKEEKRKISLTENTHAEQFRALVTSVRSDRHDLNNHLTVIAGLIKIGKYSPAADYIKNVVGDVQINNEALNIKNPVLSSMLYTKMDKYSKEQIPFILNIKSEAFTNKLSSTDLIRLISNLLDNAYEATMEMPKEEQKIVLTMTETKDAYLLTVKNSSLNKSLDDKFFELGYSTKSVHNRGYGLTIIQEITKKYNGILKSSSEDSLIVIEVQLPRSK
ncbi:sensor histidine kinase regulating citrate/malate metabolism [Evansella vedderi]|uniref:Sensor histidine kinase regulating citrate/malate metabolism n=1 Tax=Evansella vedderi TaxID=38282 RepID=A0ABT9ZP76_9BACI|nr:sensor histidine kinase regulating citrate/malate metabolism [Evansella vedderi]